MLRACELIIYVRVSRWQEIAAVTRPIHGGLGKPISVIRGEGLAIAGAITRPTASRTLATLRPESADFSPRTLEMHPPFGQKDWLTASLVRRPTLSTVSANSKLGEK
jgi:hypothetical protein